MTGHGSPPPEDRANHPNRQVSHESYAKHELGLSPRANPTRGPGREVTHSEYGADLGRDDLGASSSVFENREGRFGFVQTPHGQTGEVRTAGLQRSEVPAVFRSGILGQRTKTLGWRTPHRAAVAARSVAQRYAD